MLQSHAPVERMLEHDRGGLGAGWQSGMFLFADTDLKLDLPEARVLLDRERSPTWGWILPASAASSARCLAGVRQPLQLL